MSTDDAMLEKPLRGVRVLDFTWATGGPYGTLLLAFLGAEVVKIENPPNVTGVSTRQMLLPKYHHHGDDIHFMTYNRSKKSMVIDLRSSKGRDVFYDLVKESDVVFDNFRPGVTERLKIDYDRLVELNPRIITCSVSGYGENGPDSAKAAFDTIIEASSGITSLLGSLLPPETKPPCYPGTSWADHVGGLGGAFAVLAALYSRTFTGKGRKIDLAMQDMLISMMGYAVTGTANFENFADPLPHMLWGSFKTKDGYIVLCGHREGMWQKLIKSIGREAWRSDPRFGTHAERIENGEVLRRMVEDVLMTDTSAHWLEVLQKGDVPCTAVNTVKEVIDSEQTSARRMVVGFEHKGKEIKAPGNPFKLSGLTETIKRPPALGEHTRWVLSDLLNYPEEKIRLLMEEGAVA